jgi:hypothetical protein
LLFKINELGREGAIMKLTKFKTDKNKKIRNILITLGAIIILVGGIIFYRSYAIYEEDKTFNVLKGQVPNFTRNDIELAYTINGEKSETFPEKGNYKVNVSCDNATGNWDYEKWAMLVTDATNEKVKCSVAFNEIYTEEILNGADPVISDNLIAVNIADDGTVTKADTTKEWYKYESKKWANAVILKNKTITYDDGATIPEDNIESYFVWIPKYSYQLWNLGTYTSATEISSLDELTGSDKQDTINIKFGITNTSDSKSGECTTPLVSGESGNCKVGDYMTHPAFINVGTNGLWVGKFETGYDGATTTSEAQVSSTDSTKIIVKPNVYSWRSNTVYNFFMASYNYNRNLDSHMMKNTEWGAVAYLSYSKYGINGEIWINNSSNYVTGCVGNSVSASTYNGCVNSYNTVTGYNGSTTGNITGIYDLSGGAYELVAAYIDGYPLYSGFTSDNLMKYAKYLDVYNASSSITTYNYRILGDATGEIGPFYAVGGYYYRNNWFQDISYFVLSSYPWFHRGGAYYDGTGAGQFNFHRTTGSSGGENGTRLVLAT